MLWLSLFGYINANIFCKSYFYIPNLNPKNDTKNYKLNGVPIHRCTLHATFVLFRCEKTPCLVRFCLSY